MNKKDEALKLALEALEEARLHIWLGDEKGVSANIKCHQTIAAIDEALAKAQPRKPLVSAKDAWMKRKRETFPKDYDESRFANWAENYRHEFMRGWNACALDHGIMSVPDGKGDA